MGLTELLENIKGIFKKSPQTEEDPIKRVTTIEQLTKEGPESSRIADTAESFIKIGPYPKEMKSEEELKKRGFEKGVHPGYSHPLWMKKSCRNIAYEQVTDKNGITHYERRIVLHDTKIPKH